MLCVYSLDCNKCDIPISQRKIDLQLVRVNFRGVPLQCGGALSKSNKTHSGFQGCQDRRSRENNLLQNLLNIFPHSIVISLPFIQLITTF